MIGKIAAALSVAAVLAVTGADVTAQQASPSFKDSGPSLKDSGDTIAPAAKPEAAKPADAARIPQLKAAEPVTRDASTLVQNGYANRFDGFVSMNSGR